MYVVTASAAGPDAVIENPPAPRAASRSFRRLRTEEDRELDELLLLLSSRAFSAGGALGCLAGEAFFSCSNFGAGGGLSLLLRLASFFAFFEGGGFEEPLASDVALRFSGFESLLLSFSSSFFSFSFVFSFSFSLLFVFEDSLDDLAFALFSACLDLSGFSEASDRAFERDAVFSEAFASFFTSLRSLFRSSFRPRSLSCSLSLSFSLLVSLSFDLIVFSFSLSPFFSLAPFRSLFLSSFSFAIGNNTGNVTRVVCVCLSM
mmetsp:Transcript_84979/g.177605  ORF Transcript_84979/g.177605 Transcript_84979/m.177605 type:complete len:261 (+) Transcript_84979:1298-2080(+)